MSYVICHYAFPSHISYVFLSLPSVQADMMPAAKLKELESLAETIARLADPKNEL